MIQNISEKSAGEVDTNKPFKTINDLLAKIDRQIVNKKVIENLVYAGCFDSIDVNRKEMIYQLENRKSRMPDLFQEVKAEADKIQAEADLQKAKNAAGEANRKATNVTKGYNDIRKTNLNEVKIVNGKFSIKESLNGDKRPLSNEVKKHFLEIISTYNTFQEQMKRASDLTEVANTLGGIVEAARELTLRETADWFDGVTVKRNMSELDKMDKSFQKFAVEARAMDERLHSLYEDMGHILSRYYEIADIQPDVMKERLGLRKK
jgi:DNA polymerase III alpha subunit